MAAPSLHEIAAMPFPASMLAMRKHYNKDWHKPEREFAGDTEIAQYRVEVSYSVRTEESVTYTVYAASLADAEEQAEKLFDNDRSIDSDAEVDDVIAEKVDG